MPKIGFIGAGKVGTALAIMLSQRGYPVVAAASRSPASAQKLAQAVPGCWAHEDKQAAVDAAEVIFVTTPDDAIAHVVAEIRWRPGQSVVHCSGAASLDILEPARLAGAQVGGFHPLQAFPTTAHAIENLPGSTFALEGEGPLLATLEEMALALGGRVVKLKAGDKALYHAASAIACNYAVTLIKLATDLFGHFGLPPRETTQALLPLLRGNLNNVANIGLPHCLTGPIARGDLGTIRRHLEALERVAPSLLPLYRGLGYETIPIALAKGGIDEERARELRNLLKPI